MKKIFSSALLAVAVMAFASFSQADHHPQPKKARGTPFRGKIGAVDKTAKTITLESKEKPRTFQITSETRMRKDRKPATLDDVQVGDSVGGAARENAEGKL